MILHTVNKNTGCLKRCLSLLSEGDTVLLLEDGVYAAMNNPENTDLWETVLPKVTLHVITDDLADRGISGQLVSRFEPADWTQFVALAAASTKVVSWG